MYRLRSSAHPWFTRARNDIYEVIGRKIITKYALSLLGPLGLAILYQDDGSFNTGVRTKSNRVNSWVDRNVLIHTLSHSRFELEALTKNIVDKFGLIFRINHVKGKGRGMRLRLRNRDIDRFFSLIEPYIVPSMLYKIGMGDSSESETTGEVLWSAWQHAEENGNDSPAISGWETRKRNSSILL